MDIDEIIIYDNMLMRASDESNLEGGVIDDGI